MAGAVPSPKNQKQATAEHNHDDPSKFYYHFLYKAVLVSIFLVILPLFPAQAPEFINQSLLTRNWELLHLIFAGIAISYGLFSWRNDEKEKEINSKFDNAQSFVSKFLQVSSFFEDEAESPVESDELENKVQTWSSQYSRNEPEKVVVGSQQSNFDDPKVTGSRIIQKPLLLPVRSLKSRVSDSDFVQPANESGRSFSINSCSSRSGPRSFSSNSSNTRSAEFEGFESPQMEDKSQESVVLRSPIPWRSRSGCMESKQEVDTPIQYVSSPSMEESEFNRQESWSVKSQTCDSSRSNSMPSLQRELSPSPSFPSESKANNAELFMKKRSFYKSSPPPPPPPPPPPLFQKSISMKPRSNFFHMGAELKRSLTSERKDIKWRGGDSRTGETAQPETASIKFAKGRKVNFVDKVVVQSDEDTETEDDDDDVGGISFSEKEIGEESNDNGGGGSASEDGPDVNKKADEFIAKFREQIRLQRIESIKRRAGVLRNSAR